MKTRMFLAGALAVFFVAACGEKKEEAATQSEPPKPESGSDPKVDPAGVKADPAPAPTPRPTPAPAATDTVSALADEVGEQLDLMGRLLAGIKDKETADKASEGMKEIGVAIKAIAVRLRKLPVPSDAEKAVINAKMEAKQEAMEQELGSPGDFLQNLDPEVAAVVQGAMLTFGQDMMEAGTAFEQYFEVEQETVEPPAPPIPDPATPPPAPTPAPAPE